MSLHKCLMRLRKIDTLPLEVLPPILSIKSGRAAGNKISDQSLLVCVVMSNKPTTVCLYQIL